MTIVPGFIDTHNHGGGEGLLYDVLVGNPYDVEFVTIDSIVEKLRPAPGLLRPAPGSTVTSTTTPRSKTSGRSTCRTSTESPPSTPSACTIAAATLPSTTARPSSSPASPKTRPTPSAALMTGMKKAS